LLIEGKKRRKLFLFTRWIATHMKRNAERRRREREKKRGKRNVEMNKKMKIKNNKSPT